MRRIVKLKAPPKMIIQAFIVNLKQSLTIIIKSLVLGFIYKKLIRAVNKHLYINAMDINVVEVM